MLKASSSRTLSWLLTAGFTFLIAWEVQLQANPNKMTTWNYAFNAGIAMFYIMAFIISLERIHNLKPDRHARRVMQYIGAVGLVWGLAFLSWTFYNLVLKVEIPYPSPTDLFFISGYPLLGLGLWHLRASYRTKKEPALIRDSTIIVIVSAIVIFAFLNRPDLSGDLGLSKNILNVVYSLGDVMLVAVALVELRSGQAKRYGGLYTLILFLLFQACADFIFSYQNNVETYWNGNIADFLFGTSGYLLALTLAQDNLLKHDKR